MKIAEGYIKKFNTSTLPLLLSKPKNSGKTPHERNLGYYKRSSKVEMQQKIKTFDI